eukprot:360794-Chlamydomonas_euryale.AAC.11
MSGRTRLTKSFTSTMPLASSRPATRSASRIDVISGVVTTTASRAGDTALMKPMSMPAGQSIRMNLGRDGRRGCLRRGHLSGAGECPRPRGT